MKTHTIVLIGLGATGVAMGTSLARRPDCKIVGAADVDPSKAGQRLGALISDESSDVVVVDSIRALPDADIAFVATTSFVRDLEATLTDLARRKMNVVSICEELGHPFRSHPDLSERLDKVARDNGVSILGTGCNPGMLMDSLPTVLSSLTQRVSRVEIRRTADMSGYGAILRKFGLGLDSEAFQEAQSAGHVVGHVGFEQSVQALAAALGWELDEIVVDDPEPAFISERARHGDHFTIEPGTIAAVRHAVQGRRDGVVMIDAAIHFGFFEEYDPVDPGDHWLIHGEEQMLELRASSGFDSFLSTIAVASNSITAVADAPAGLRTMGDLPIGAVASKGALRTL